jgi:hypothetical protein
MAGAASAHQAVTASREQNSQQRAVRTRRTSADPQRAQQGATAAAAAPPAALDSLSRLQQLADASPRVAQLRRLQALADGRFAPVAQLAGGPEEEELIQGKFAAAQLQSQLQQAPRANNTGLPDQLKSGIESLSGLSMDHVRVHFNSSQPAQLNALAYAQGSDIHVAPGQEQHLPHEAWHVVQQAQGRVQPTMQMKVGVPVNDDPGLEHEADVMGARALQVDLTPLQFITSQRGNAVSSIVQRTLAEDLKSGATNTAIAGETHGEIPEAIERKRWNAWGVNVMYEHEALPISGKKPDKSILRVVHAWTMLNDIAQKFWLLVSANEDVRNAPGVLKEHRTLAGIIKNDLKEIGLGVDERCIMAYDLLDVLCAGLPLNETVLLALPRLNQQYLADKKLALLPRIDALMSEIHRRGSFGDVSMDDDSLRTERSHEMLLTINAAKPQKTVYKVGDLHVDDMQRQKWRHDAAVAVLPRKEYLSEFADADIDPASGGKAVFNSIGDDML